MGHRGLEWCDALPARVDGSAEAGKLRVAYPAVLGATSCVLFCSQQDGEAAVLKLSPNAAWADTEVRALNAWRTSGRVPRVLAFEGESRPLAKRPRRYQHHVPRGRRAPGNQPGAAQLSLRVGLRGAGGQSCLHGRGTGHLGVGRRASGGTGRRGAQVRELRRWGLRQIDVHASEQFVTQRSDDCTGPTNGSDGSESTPSFPDRQVPRLGEPLLRALVKGKFSEVR